MALSGSIKEFGLADIFQLIGIQRKTGRLVMAGPDETVTIKFQEGRVVEADRAGQSVEDLLGAVLVRTGRISQEQLEEALKVQRKTLQRLGHILVRGGAITEDQLVDALRVQSLQMIYRLFRWKEGKYSFETAKDVDYDDRHFHPIDAETILMEGARMVDEWPMIERRIRSDDMVLRPTEEATAVGDADDALASLGVDGAIDGAFDDAFGLGDQTPVQATPQAEEPLLSPEERRIFDLADGSLTVQQINDRSPYGEFDTYRILADLVTRKLLQEVDSIARRGEHARKHRWAEGLVASLLALVAFAGVGVVGATLSSNPFTPWRMASQTAATDQLRTYSSLYRLERIEQALRTHYFDRGSYPTLLAELAAGSYVDSADLLDPWGRPYGYQLSPGGYRLFGVDADGQPAPSLDISYRFSAAQQMLLEELPAPSE